MAEAEATVVLDIEEECKRIVSTLLSFLPDADPQYLRDISEQYAWEPDRLTTFINSSIDNNIYPKISHNNQVVPQLLKTYSIEEFLKKYPDPFNYFSEKSVGKQFYADSKIYFYNRFRKLTAVVILKNFRDCNFNLLCTKLRLSNISFPSRKTLRPISDDNFQANDQTFYDEIFFLDNIDSINKEKTVLQERRKEAKLKGELLTCQCCFDDEVLSEEILPCTECHLFCKNCIQKSVEISMGEGVYNFCCLNSDPSCLGKFDMVTIKTVLSNEAFEILCTKMQAVEVRMAEVDGIFFCPFCEFGAIPVQESKIFKCAKCEKESCRECKEEAHIPYKCDENKQKKAASSRIYVENQMTLALLRECWRCKKNFIKSDGCNKMKCVCGATMCYLCKQEKVDYNHFTNHPKSVKNKCPLYSTNEDLHFHEVINAAKKAKLELQTLNLPEVESDFDFLKGLTKKNV